MASIFNRAFDIITDDNKKSNQAIPTLCSSNQILNAIAPRFMEHRFVPVNVMKVLSSAPTFIFTRHVAMMGFSYDNDTVIEYLSKVERPSDFRLWKTDATDDVISDIIKNFPTIENVELDRNRKMTPRAYARLVMEIPREILQKSVCENITEIFEDFDEDDEYEDEGDDIGGSYTQEDIDEFQSEFIKCGLVKFLMKELSSKAVFKEHETQYAYLNLIQYICKGNDEFSAEDFKYFYQSSLMMLLDDAHDDILRVMSALCLSNISEGFPDKIQALHDEDVFGHVAEMIQQGVTGSGGGGMRTNASSSGYMTTENSNTSSNVNFNKNNKGERAIVCFLDLLYAGLENGGGKSMLRRLVFENNFINVLAHLLENPFSYADLPARNPDSAIHSCLQIFVHICGIFKDEICDNETFNILKLLRKYGSGDWNHDYEDGYVVGIQQQAMKCILVFAIRNGFDENDYTDSEEEDFDDSDEDWSIAVNNNEDNTEQEQENDQQQQQEQQQQQSAPGVPGSRRKHKKKKLQQQRQQEEKKKKESQRNSWKSKKGFRHEKSWYIKYALEEGNALEVCMNYSNVCFEYFHGDSDVQNEMFESTQSFLFSSFINKSLRIFKRNSTFFENFIKPQILNNVGIFCGLFRATVEGYPSDYYSSSSVHRFGRSAKNILHLVTGFEDDDDDADFEKKLFAKYILNQFCPSDCHSPLAVQINEDEEEAKFTSLRKHDDNNDNDNDNTNNNTNNIKFNINNTSSPSATASAAAASSSSATENKNIGSSSSSSAYCKSAKDASILLLTIARFTDLATTNYDERSLCHELFRLARRIKQLLTNIAPLCIDNTCVKEIQKKFVIKISREHLTFLRHKLSKIAKDNNNNNNNNNTNNIDHDDNNNNNAPTGESLRFDEDAHYSLQEDKHFFYSNFCIYYWSRIIRNLTGVLSCRSGKLERIRLLRRGGGGGSSATTRTRTNTLNSPGGIRSWEVAPYAYKERKFFSQSRLQRSKKRRILEGFSNFYSDDSDDEDDQFCDDEYYSFNDAVQNDYLTDECAEYDSSDDDDMYGWGIGEDDYSSDDSDYEYLYHHNETTTTAETSENKNSTSSSGNKNNNKNKNKQNTTSELSKAELLKQKMKPYFDTEKIDRLQGVHYFSDANLIDAALSLVDSVVSSGVIKLVGVVLEAIDEILDFSILSARYLNRAECRNSTQNHVNRRYLQTFDIGRIRAGVLKLKNECEDSVKILEDADVKEKLARQEEKRRLKKEREEAREERRESKRRRNVDRRRRNRNRYRDTDDDSDDDDDEYDDYYDSDAYYYHDSDSEYSYPSSSSSEDDNEEEDSDDDDSDDEPDYRTVEALHAQKLLRVCEDIECSYFNEADYTDHQNKRKKKRNLKFKHSRRNRKIAKLFFARTVMKKILID